MHLKTFAKRALDIIRSITFFSANSPKMASEQGLAWPKIISRESINSMQVANKAHLVEMIVAMQKNLLLLMMCNALCKCFQVQVSRPSFMTIGSKL